MRRRATCAAPRGVPCAWPAASLRACRPTSLKAINLALLALVAVALLSTPATANDATLRATARARGTDRATAIAVGRAILIHPPSAQLTRIRCERLGQHRICGLVLSGVKFKRPLDRRAFIAEVAGAIRTAFATAPLEEVDLWTTVPLEVARGVVVSGDAAVATSATVFAISVPRAALGRLDQQLAGGHDVFWEPTFAAALQAVPPSGGRPRF